MTRRGDRYTMLLVGALLGVSYTGPSLAHIDIGKLVKAIALVSDQAEIDIGKGIAANLLGVAAPVNDPACRLMSMMWADG